MDDLLQILVMFWSLFVLAVKGLLLMIVIMTLMTTVTKDECYFTKKLKRFMED